MREEGHGEEDLESVVLRGLYRLGAPHACCRPERMRSRQPRKLASAVSLALFKSSAAWARRTRARPQRGSDCWFSKMSRTSSAWTTPLIAGRVSASNLHSSEIEVNHVDLIHPLLPQRCLGILIRPFVIVHATSRAYMHQKSPVTLNSQCYCLLFSCCVADISLILDYPCFDT